MKIKIKNRKDQEIVAIVEESKKVKGLVFVLHGLGGFKEQAHIETFAKAFLESGYTVIRYDSTNSFGESDGNYEDATVTNYYEDLEDVIEWSKKQDWYQEPFVLVGHSLGGICSALYAEKYPEKVKALAPISTLVSGEISLETYSKEELENWEKSGWQIRESVSKPGEIKKLKWSHMENRLKYDLLKNTDKLKMPVLMMVGDKDTNTPLKHQQMLFDVLPGQKEIHVIKDAMHTFREQQHLDEIKDIFINWIKLI